MEAGSSGSARSERVVLETDRHTIVGDVTLPGEGYQNRLSDLINRPDVGFIPLLQVEVTAHEGGATERHSFAVVSKAHIRLARPAAAG